MKIIRNFFLSMSTLGMLLFLLAFSIALATFIESKFNTETAWILIYNSWWFELLLFWFSLILIYNIFSHKFIQKKKWTLLIFHGSFLFILLGAFITRYFGYEGSMYIPENKTVNYIFSKQPYIQIKIENNQKFVEKNHAVQFSEFTNNKFKNRYNLNNKDVTIELNKFISNAIEKIETVENGYPILEILVKHKDELSKQFINQGNIKLINDILISFDTLLSADIVFNYSDSLTFSTLSPVITTNMKSRVVDTIPKGKRIVAESNMIYEIGDFKFIINNFLPSAVFSFENGNSDNNLPDALIFDITHGEQLKKLIIKGKQGLVGKFSDISIGDNKVQIAYGSLIEYIPFSLTLNDFVLERYPGSNSPSSFISYVTLTDNRKNLKRDEKIFMNNVLSYSGYRFYQSSYDKDEKGTILSVNQDKIGTTITYIGYFLMILGMVFSLFYKRTRFVSLIKSLKKIVATIFIFFSIFPTLFANDISDSIPVIPKKDAMDLSRICVQDKGGRIKPLHTLSNEAILKITGKQSFNGLSSQQVFFSMMAFTLEWQKIPMIKVKNEKIIEILGISSNYATFKDFFYLKKFNENPYKLSVYVNDAYRKNTALRSKFEKDIIKVDERFSICYLIYAYDIFRVFPEIGSKEKRWIAPKMQTSMKGKEKQFVESVITLYFDAVKKNNNEQKAIFLKGIHDFQNKYGSEILPSKLKIDLEILYNKLLIFKRLFPINFIVGIFLTILIIIKTINTNLKFRGLIIALISISIVSFVLQTFGLASRWYISGHAPWSNSYESLLYISWITVLAGFIFAKRSILTISLSAGLSGLCLFVAHLSWINPEITNLVPVLKSYWLSIHVAVIIAGYGFLALSALLGLVNLTYFLIAGKKNISRLLIQIKKLTIINESSLIVGLYLLTIGTILGGIWANESWGRYWAWDPKEAWALITILTYVFVLHMRYIPFFKNIFSFNIASFLAISSVIMTYLGVNYFLSGLHSYAGGEQFNIPFSVYIFIILLFIFLLISSLKYKKLRKYF